MERVCPICQRKYETKATIESIIKDFPDKKDFWIEIKCPNYNNHFKILRDREIAKLSLETKQKILDLMHEGKSVGEVCKILKLDSQIVAEIICQNFGTIRYLKTEIES